MNIFDVNAEPIFGTDGLQGIHRRQFIPADYLAQLADERQVSTHVRAPEAVRVASIPVALVESWQRQGFDVFKEDARAIVARLRKENLTGFLATSREV